MHPRGRLSPADQLSVPTEINAVRWYHTIDLPGGILTPGEYDTRIALNVLPFPASLAGRRCLDVGTHDGFWAFEMERRDASEVIAIDLDDPRQVDFSEPGPVWSEQIALDRESRPEAFATAHRALGSEVVRRDLSVYRLSTEEVGQFDFAFLGTLLLHLRDPVLALTRVREVLRPGGRLLINDAVSLAMTIRHPLRPIHQLTLLPGKPYWWMPNARGLAQYAAKAGFTVLQTGRPYFLPRGAGYARPPLPLTLTNFASRVLHNRGMVHAWVLAQAP